jgi:putative endopeptidase
VRITLFSVLVLAVACNADKKSPPPPPSPAPTTPAPVVPPAKPDAAPVAKLDESKLPPLLRWSKADLDPAVSACTDLAAHANKKWEETNPVPSDRTTWGAFETLVERSIELQRQIAGQMATKSGATGVDKIVGDLWATGMDDKKINEQGVAPLAGRLAEIDKLADGAAVAELLRTSHARGEPLVFGFGPEADFKQSDMNIAYVTQGGLGLPDRTYYVDADKQPKRDAYRAHIAKVLELSGVPAAAAATGAQDVLAFETRLAKVSKSAEELSRDVSLYYNPTSPADADKLTPAFPWTKFFATQGVTITMFSLSVPAFHQEVSKMLGDVPVATWKTYLRFHTVDGLSLYLGDAFQNEQFNFYGSAMRGQKEIKPRWKRVLDAINGQAGEALGQLYVKVAFPPDSKARMEQLVANLRAALKERLDKLSWMTPATRKKALDKWERFASKIGYPDKWRDYSGLATTRDSYVANVLAATAFNFKYEVAKIGKPVDRAEWGMSPQTVNASYNPLKNDITFPAAILQPPFFDPKADDPINYGAIGAVIGHEMIHGYDDQGSRFGPTGNFENWWDKADATGFSTLTNKLVAQFDAYEALPGKKVKGKLTLGENIADLGGIAVAYDAMKRATAEQPDPKVDGFTREQRFFYGWATVWRRNHTKDELELRLTTDPHAPAKFRAIGAPSNLATFAEAFGCKPGDPMVRDKAKQIAIW